MKKIFFVILSLFLLSSLNPVLAAGDKVENVGDKIEINFFYSKTCPHCADENDFLDKLVEKYPSQLKIYRLPVSDSHSVEMLNDFYKEYEVSETKQGLVPATFIGDKYFIGFSESIGQEIEGCISNELGYLRDQDCNCQGHSEEDEEEIELPLLGQLNIKDYSLFSLSVIAGILDGFNVCSLGALVMILALVMSLKSRKKVLIFGGIFILTTAVIYGLLIILWYQLFTWLAPYLGMMEILIGLIGLIGGTYFLRQFLKFRKQGPVCEMNAGKGIMNRFSSFFKNSIQDSRNIFLLLLGVLIFSAIITIVEFPCSAAVPMAFAGILAEAGLSTFAYLSYISVFVFFYMFDEILVFLIAFFAMRLWLASNRAIVWITLVEAIILYLLGIYYLFGFDFLL